MTRRRKTFKDNLSPAMQFISTPEPEETDPQTGTIEAPPEGHKVNPIYVETRSKRLQLLVQPSLHAKIKQKADREGVSMNELIHTILEEATKEED